MEIASLSQLGLAFFGLTQDKSVIYRKNLFQQIHEIVFHGKGGYDWDTIYNMPVWLRKFTFHEIMQYYKKESKEIKQSSKSQNGEKTLIDSSGKINTPNFKEASKNYKKPASYK
tara:strand:+ start:120 stop:461 length:342 start_codon:yes stop_codon:yes gene_type:complete